MNTLNAAKLKQIVEIDRCASISAAAGALGLTQSTLSRSLADIEKDIGYALFDRRARDVVATERGRHFINRAARIISDLDQLADDARQSRESGDTLIRVGVSPPSMNLASVMQTRSSCQVFASASRKTTPLSNRA